MLFGRPGFGRPGFDRPGFAGKPALDTTESPAPLAIARLPPSEKGLIGGVGLDCMGAFGAVVGKAQIEFTQNQS